MWSDWFLSADTVPLTAGEAQARQDEAPDLAIAAE